MTEPRLYGELARYWPVLSAPADYAEEAAFFADALQHACGGARSLLELGSGGGNNASHMKARFAEVVLVDRAAGMLAHSRRLNPECAHIEGDMRTVRLHRHFDCVFVHDAIAYMLTADELRSALTTAFVHCRPGGAALFAPDHVKETFTPSTECGGEDGESGALRYLEWTWDPDPSDSQCVVDYAYLIRERDGSVRAEHDRHVEGLFGRQEWLELLAQVGFVPRVLPFDHSELPPGSYELFVATRPVTPG